MYSILQLLHQNKKILVTGCYGFVAQHLIFTLLKNNNHVVGIYNKKYQTQKPPFLPILIDLDLNLDNAF